MSADLPDGRTDGAGHSSSELPLWLVVTRNTEKDRSESRIAHRDYMRRLVAEGLVFASGPAAADHADAPFGGATVLRVDTREEARRIMEAEPYVSAGARTYELIAWRVAHGDYATPA